LIYWFKTPQKYWLNKNNISPKEIFIHHPDEEYVSNLQKSQIITKIIQQVEIDNHNIIDNLNELNKRLSAQKGINVDFQSVSNANHFFSKADIDLIKILNKYIKKETALY